MPTDPIYRDLGEVPPDVRKIVYPEAGPCVRPGCLVMHPEGFRHDVVDGPYQFGYTHKEFQPYRIDDSLAGMFAPPAEAPEWARIVLALTHRFVTDLDEALAQLIDPAPFPGAGGLRERLAAQSPPPPADRSEAPHRGGFHSEQVAGSGGGGESPAGARASSGSLDRQSPDWNPGREGPPPQGEVPGARHETTPGSAGTEAPGPATTGVTSGTRSVQASAEPPPTWKRNVRFCFVHGYPEPRSDRQSCVAGRRTDEACGIFEAEVKVSPLTT